MPHSQIPESKAPAGAMVGHSIDNGNLQFTKLVGVGTYGEVYHTADRNTGEVYAVKVLPRKSPAAQPSPMPTDKPYVDARLLCREVALYSRIPPHSNIIQLKRMLHTHDQLFMVMEHCAGGDLYENISNNPYFHLPGNDALIRRLFLQLVSAIEHCHNNGIYHRDIKPENVLVTHDGLNVKIIDFGLSTDQPWCREIGCGSAYYMSPECQGGINGNVQQYAAAPNDVWALGVILINLATGRNPWNKAHVSDPLFHRYLTDKYFLCNAIHATPEFQHIIHRTLEVDPTKRCSLQELRQLVQNCHRFVNKSSLATRHVPHAPAANSVKQQQARPRAVPQPAAYQQQQPMQMQAARISPAVAQQPSPAAAMCHGADSMSLSSAESGFSDSTPANSLFGYHPFTTSDRHKGMKASVVEATHPSGVFGQKQFLNPGSYVYTAATGN
ncbi:Serine/threonine protein kinase [Linderina pennispora]|nr:Serine/threonine protein kinase [Linderina pennispora]